jgi:hypothetical protein
VFYIEPWGQLTAAEIAATAAEVFKEMLAEFEEKIKEIGRGFPEGFSPDKVNKDSRFPVNRVREVDADLYEDKWLTTARKSKKPICFNTPTYTEQLKNSTMRTFASAGRKG